MDKEILQKEIEILEIAYKEEKDSNGGHDGTVFSLILRSKIEILRELIKKYY